MEMLEGHLPRRLGLNRFFDRTISTAGSFYRMMADRIILENGREGTHGSQRKAGEMLPLAKRVVKKLERRRLAVFS